MSCDRQWLFEARWAILLLVSLIDTIEIGETVIFYAHVPLATIVTLLTSTEALMLIYRFIAFEETVENRNSSSCADFLTKTGSNALELSKPSHSISSPRGLHNEKVGS